MSELKRFAEHMLCIMVLDLSYDYAPKNGWHPIRHQIAWQYIVEVLGEDEVARLVEYHQNSLEKGLNKRVPINPTKAGSGE